MGFDDGRVYGESGNGLVGLYRYDLIGLRGELAVSGYTADRGGRTSMGDFGHWFLREFALRCFQFAFALLPDSFATMGAIAARLRYCGH